MFEGDRLVSGDIVPAPAESSRSGGTTARHRRSQAGAERCGPRSRDSSRSLQAPPPCLGIHPDFPSHRGVLTGYGAVLRDSAQPRGIQGVVRGNRAGSREIAPSPREARTISRDTRRCSGIQAGSAGHTTLPPDLADCLAGSVAPCQNRSAGSGVRELERDAGAAERGAERNGRSANERRQKRGETEVSPHGTDGSCRC